ncbi:hypothetical protein OL239_11035 [Arthrobacter sp. ATA002]|nr:hypothetical protein OL239_11035 [Arthrobacter sp. ATA002]
MSFRVRYRGVLLTVSLERTVLRVSAAPGGLPRSGSG